MNVSIFIQYYGLSSFILIGDRSRDGRLLPQQEIRHEYGQIRSTDDERQETLFESSA